MDHHNSCYKCEPRFDKPVLRTNQESSLDRFLQAKRDTAHIRTILTAILAASLGSPEPSMTNAGRASQSKAGLRIAMMRKT